MASLCYTHQQKARVKISGCDSQTRKKKPGLGTLCSSYQWCTVFFSGSVLPGRSRTAVILLLETRDGRANEQSRRHCGRHWTFFVFQERVLCVHVYGIIWIMQSLQECPHPRACPTGHPSPPVYVVVGFAFHPKLVSSLQHTMPKLGIITTAVSQAEGYPSPHTRSNFEVRIIAAA